MSCSRKPGGRKIGVNCGRKTLLTRPAGKNPGETGSGIFTGKKRYFCRASTIILHSSLPGLSLQIWQLVSIGPLASGGGALPDCF